jgi:hypothetical protein
MGIGMTEPGMGSLPLTALIVVKISIVCFAFAIIPSVLSNSRLNLLGSFEDRLLTVCI